MTPIQNDQQFIQTMMLQGKKKRKLEDETNLLNSKARRIAIKTEPEQVYSIKTIDFIKTYSFVFCLSLLLIPFRQLYFAIQSINPLLCVRILSVIVYHQLKKHLY